ncbi:expressed protein [Cryptococcus deneoformans JEC21]|uniref:Expressed protein n=1 Tax=Cryptococcus deneoformans (strain JEC21 / ATCC MYA-565) TaxID=214684 RepID=Q5KKY9_CRYD1|nr:expressed protein [Cryptococcus neoformans var. neoformans JEC21]AAW42152.1 expressed protein [Cryptococcus neoformans var. neoformans JEC21]
MYWYISFLRPPPVSTSNTDQRITITPQVANDLRTELRYEPTTIYYTWQRVIPSISIATTLQELTTFIPPGSTYKPLDVPLPKNVQVGESWRLGLFSHNENPHSSNGLLSGEERKWKLEPTNELLDLIDDTPDVLGVWSEGIEIARAVSGLNSGTIRGLGRQKEPSIDKGKSKGKSKGKEKEKERDDRPKQGRIMREWALPEEGTLRIIEQTSFDLDKKVWDSGLALSAWFWKHLANEGSLPLTGQKIFTLLKRQEKLRIVELGTGTGLVSIVLSLALKRIASLERKITATDLESAIPLMDENIALNNLNSQMNHISTDHENEQGEQSKGTLVDARVLDWDQPIPAWVNNDHPELVIAADVTYNTSAFPSLLSTLTSLLLPSASSASLPNRPLLVLAYKERDPAERELWGMLKEKGIDMVMVDEIKGAEDYGSTEIWIGGSSLS